ncbi:hypothetical protein STENM36S_08401 [Streptomyces tendae]
MVGEVRPGSGGAGVQDDGGGRVPQGDGPARAAAQQPVGHGQVGGEDDGVAGDALVLGDDGGDAAAGPLEAGDVAAEAQVGPGRDGGVGHGAGQGVHAAAREVDAGDGVHVGDDGVCGQRAGRRDTGVQGLEGEDPLEPFVRQEPSDAALQAAEAAEGGEPGEVGGEQAERRVEVGVDEPAHLHGVQPPEPVAQPPVPGRLPGSGEPFDLRLHRVGVGVHVQGGAVGEARPVGGVQGQQVDAVAQPFADGREGLVGQVRHGQHGRSGVEVVAAEFTSAGPAAGQWFAFHDGHPPPRAQQVQGGGQPGESGPDDHDVVGAAGHRPRHRALRPAGGPPAR